MVPAELGHPEKGSAPAAAGAVADAQSVRWERLEVAGNGLRPGLIRRSKLRVSSIATIPTTASTTIVRPSHRAERAKRCSNSRSCFFQSYPITPTVESNGAARLKRRASSR